MVPGLFTQVDLKRRTTLTPPSESPQKKKTRDNPHQKIEPFSIFAFTKAAAAAHKAKGSTDKEPSTSSSSVHTDNRKHAKVEEKKIEQKRGKKRKWVSSFYNFDVSLFVG